MTGIHAYTESKPGTYQAQHGEDRWLEHYFRGAKSGFFVEVGAYDGLVLSNTFFLESLGWRGILVEPVPEKARRCRENRPHARVFECAAVAPGTPAEIQFDLVEGGEVYSTSAMTPEHAARLVEYGLTRRSIAVSTRTLDSILEEVAPKRVDFVSIDVEGAELDVLRGFDLDVWHPRVVMIEVNTPRRSDEIARLFRSAGYVYLTSLGINDVYVPLTEFKTLTWVLDTARYGARRTRRILGGVVRRVLRTLRGSERPGVA